MDLLSLIMHIALSVKFSADDILKYFFPIFAQKTCFDISCQLKCQILCSEKNIISLSSNELAKRVVKVKKRTLDSFIMNS